MVTCRTLRALMQMFTGQKAVLRMPARQKPDLTRD